MQRVEKLSAARRVGGLIARLLVRWRNNADGCFSARPMGAHQIGQCGVAALDKGGAIAGRLRLALTDLMGSASAIITWTEH